MKLCLANSCQRHAFARGYCTAHYQSMRKSGWLEKLPVNQTCSVDGCTSQHLAKGYCRTHYQRMYKHGSLEKLIMRGEPVLDRIMAKVLIKPNGCWLFTGSIAENGYGGIRHNGKWRRAHVVTYELKYGPVPDGLELDHFFCNTRACCNPDHVEPVTHLENIRRSNLVGRACEKQRNSIGQFIGKAS